jgi:hypothetical protein
MNAIAIDITSLGDSQAPRPDQSLNPRCASAVKVSLLAEEDPTCCIIGH